MPAKKSDTLSDVEKEALRETVKERKKQPKAGSPEEREQGEADIQAKIAEMPPADRAMAKKIHELVAKTAPAVVPRLEGDPKTRFFGRCDDGEQETILKGRVPQRYAYNLAGDRLQCSIQKRGSGGGSLKVILTAGNTTRSVQQVNSSGGEINISYNSGG